MSIIQRCIFFAVVTATVCKASAAGPQYTLTTLVTFNSANGAYSQAGLIADASGNLYGTTANGGANDEGTVFKIANDASHTLSTLATFSGTNGGFPYARLIADSGGNLYGTTVAGGPNGYGTVFKVANDANHTLSTLATFNNFNGGGPYAGLITDAGGNLYGTTYEGGDLTLNGGRGYGTVFKVANDASHTLSTLLAFNNTNGGSPFAGLIVDAGGNLYGTTSQGGASGYGTVFKVANEASHTLTTLATFNNTNGANPYAGLIADASGNLYGTTSQGGASGVGTVFKVANDAGHTLSTLATFNDTNGYDPNAGLIADAGGNLYGTTVIGGANNRGTVFEVANDASHTLSTLATFNGTNGDSPYAGLFADASGNLYSTTYLGGTNDIGTVFELSPVPEPTSFLLAALALPAVYYVTRRRM